MSFHPGLGSHSVCFFAHFSPSQTHQAAICFSPCWRDKAGFPESPRVVSRNPPPCPYWWEPEVRGGWVGQISSPEFRPICLGQWEGKSRGDQVTTLFSLSSFPSLRYSGWGEGYGVTNKELLPAPGGRRDMTWQGLGTEPRETNTSLKCISKHTAAPAALPDIPHAVLRLPGASLMALPPPAGLLSTVTGP